MLYWGFPGGSDGKESACNAGGSRFDPWIKKIPLEEEMATHSSILARRILQKEEPRELQSTGSQRVEHN